MIDVDLLLKEPDKFIASAKNKGYEFDAALVSKLLQDSKHLQTEVEGLRARRNQISEKLSRARDENTLKEAAQLKEKLGQLEEKLKEFAPKLKEQLYKIPSLHADDVKIGAGESANEVIKTHLQPTKFNFTPLDHTALGEKLDLIDTVRAAKISGSRFYYLKNEAVLLEFGLLQLAFTTLIKEGFTPVIPPVLVKPDVASGLGYWEGLGKDDYYLINDGEEGEYYLVGTAEHSLVPMHKDEILESLPKRYVGFSTCFRREAGSYGKDTQGILRVHQFDKVEMVSFTKEEDSDKEHEFLLSLEEKLFQTLKIPYQVIKMGSGDLGFPIARKYDIEAWIPTQNKYREVTSASTATDFQARRLNIRYREGEKTKYAHILNGTAFAMPRTIIAILENYQQEDGSIIVPEALIPYVGLEKISR